MDDDLAAVLARLEGGGRFDSTGSFTLDLLSASGKLRTYQTDPPERYILRLVQAAVASGSEVIAVDTRSRQLHFRFDRQILSPAELEQLPQKLTEWVLDSGRRELQHFSTGLSSSLALDLRLLAIESWGAEGAAVFTMTGGEQRFGRVAGHHLGSGTAVTLMKQHGWYDRELKLLRVGTTLCPAEIHVGAHTLPRGQFGAPALPRLSFLMGELLRLNDDYIFGKCHRHHHLLEVRWPDSGGALTVARSSPASERRLAGPCPDDVSWVRCRQVLAIEMELRQTSRLRFVRDGVDVATVEPFGITWGSVGAIGANHLRTDLSQTRILEDDAYKATLDQVIADSIQLEAIMHELVASEDYTRFPLPTLIKSRFCSPRGMRSYRE